MQHQIDLIIHPCWTLLSDGHTRVESGLSVAVDKGRILAIGPRASLVAQFAADVEHERPEHILMPGLVNAHCHAAMSLLRGSADDVPLNSWLHEHIWPTEAKWISRQFVADGTRLAVAEMLLGGTTCFADMYYFPDAVADVALETGMRASVGMIALEFPTVWAETPNEYIAKGLELHDAMRSEALVTTCFAPHAPYTVADPTLARIRLLADELEVPIHMHLHETAAEIADAQARDGKRPLARLRDLDCISAALMAVHCTHVNDEEIGWLGDACASVVHCPRSNLKLASGAGPVARLMAAGANVALGTDGAASNNRLDMWSEMQHAALLGKLVADDATAVSAATAIDMATIHGARALGLGEQIGSLEPGKLADLICVDMSGVHLAPVTNPLSQLVYAAGRSDVRDVWVAGEHLVGNGQLLRLDVDEVTASAKQWANAMRGAE